MLRKLTILLMSLALCLTTAACSSPDRTQSQQNRNTNIPAPTQLSQGQYPVQQASYNDVDGEYTVMLLNTPPGTPSVYRTGDLQMARLTEEEIQNGKQTYLEVNNGQAVMHLTPEFKIEYVHNVTETRTDPQTGQQETIIVRQQSGFWAPFAGALAGQALGSLLFAPRYYVPPVYQPGGVMTGYGGYGSSYREAVTRYQTRYNQPPAAVRNRQTFRTTGRLRSPSANQPSTVRRTNPNANRSTGSGYGGSRLRTTGKSTPSRTQRPSGFGSSGSRSRPSRSRSFGTRRR